MLWAMESAPVTDPTSAMIVMALADRAADDGTAAWPSHQQIADRARVSVATVKRRLRELEDTGVIRRGDQELVSHFQPRHRPVVWDLVMDSAIAHPIAQNEPSPESDSSNEAEPTPCDSSAVSYKQSLSTSYGSRTVHSARERANADPSASKTSSKGTRITEDWLPPEPVRQSMMARYPGVDYRHEHEKFIDYWLSKPGAAGVKLDWDATWRNWIRTAYERNRDYQRGVVAHQGVVGDPVTGLVDRCITAVNAQPIRERLEWWRLPDEGPDDFREPGYEQRWIDHIVAHRDEIEERLRGAA